MENNLQLSFLGLYSSKINLQCRINKEKHAYLRGWHHEKEKPALMHKKTI